MRYYGATYYPEVFPRDQWDADVARMVEVGMNVVRLAESAWSHLEPDEGQFSFGWLDEAIALCQRHGVSVVLATPTYIPPLWLVTASPDILPRRADKQRSGSTGRHHYCLHSPSFQSATRRIVHAMAERFGNHPTVIGWQVHNEFGPFACYCDHCLHAWHDWLEQRYGTIDALNAAWRNDCWGHTYGTFAQVPLPSEEARSPESQHPLALTQAHRRFRSDAVCRYQRLQVAELRGRIGARWLTHNANSLALDHDDLFADLDVAGWDNYPPLWGGARRDRGTWQRVAFMHDLFRCLKGRPHWVLEQMCGSYGDSETVWAGQSAPGELATWALHSYAHGAEAVLFWPWRSLPGGNWPYWEGLLTPGGDTTERYEEIRRAGRVVQAVRQAADPQLAPDVKGEPTREPRIALLLSYDNLWALERDRGAPSFSVGAALDDLYTAAAALGLSVDVVSPQADLTPYPVVIAPALPLLHPDLARQVADYVRGGGVALVPPRTARYTPDGTPALDLPPGPLAALCGLRVRDYSAVLDETTWRVAGEVEATGRWWCDLIEPTTARVVALYAEGRYAGRPAITWNPSGTGSAFYMGTYLDPGGYERLLTSALRHAGVVPSWRLPADCEVVRAHGLTFLFNHAAEDRTVALPGRVVNVLDATEGAGPIALAPRHVLVLRDAPA